MDNRPLSLEELQLTLLIAVIQEDWATVARLREALAAREASPLGVQEEDVAGN
jgi:hypothetical protein